MYMYIHIYTNNKYFNLFDEHEDTICERQLENRRKKKNKTKQKKEVTRRKAIYFESVAPKFNQSFFNTTMAQTIRKRKILFVW